MIQRFKRYEISWLGEERACARLVFFS